MELLKLLFDIISQIFTYNADVVGLMIADPVTALAITGAAVGGAGSYFGGQSQADAAKYGADQQANLTRELMERENQLRQGQYQNLLQYLPQFSNISASMLPQFSNAPDPTKYFGTENITNSYNLAKQSLGQTMAQDVSDTASQAGALAASRGFAAPSGFVSNQTNQVRSAYAPQFTRLASDYQSNLGRNQQDLWRALFGTTQFNNQNLQNMFGNRLSMTNFNNQNAQNYFQNQLGLSNLRIGGGG